MSDTRLPPKCWCGLELQRREYQAMQARSWKHDLERRVGNLERQLAAAHEFERGVLNGLRSRMDQLEGKVVAELKRGS